MRYSPLRLNGLCLVGPGKEPASVRFFPGLNVIRGASDTGKSFIVASIDFMLAARDPLKKITESEGYNRVVLSFHAYDQKQDYTLVRGTQGGDFELFLGDHLDRPEGEPLEILKVSPKATPNISGFLLGRVGLGDRWVMKNKDGDTERLGFRNVVPFCVVSETAIQSETPPGLSEQVVLQTKSKQVFKLLLTGVDDSGIVSKKIAKASRAKTDAQAELIDELIAELEAVISADARPKDQLQEQLGRLEATLADLKGSIGVTEENFSRMRQRRFDLRQRSESNDSRQGEIESLQARLALLDQHYLSDARRLEAISEAGVIYEGSEAADCPYCGSDPAHQKHHSKAEDEVKLASAAAYAEVGKINVLRVELRETVQTLQSELTQLRGELPLIHDELSKIDGELKEQMPQLQSERGRYVELLEVRTSINFALARFNQLAKLVERKEALTRSEEADEGSPNNLIDPGLSEQTLYSFSRTVESILADWEYPEPRTVNIREKDLEVIVGGKPRASSGKGVRALLHSAFSLGLLQHSRTMGLPHPGFVVLDSPLLTYAPPEGNEPKSEDDQFVSQSSLRERFFESLRDWPEDTQILIIENVAVPDWVSSRNSTTVFTRNEDSGRYGFIPRLPAE